MGLGAGGRRRGRWSRRRRPRCGARSGRRRCRGRPRSRVRTGRRGHGRAVMAASVVGRCSMPSIMTYPRPSPKRRYRLGTASVSHAVGADAEDMAVAVHGARVDRQHHRPSPAGADTGGGLAVGGEMHGVPVHGSQALGSDRVQVPGDGAVIQPGRRDGGRQLEVHRDGVALAGADPAPSTAKRRLSLAATTWSSSSRVNGKPWSAAAAISASISTQPAASGASPIRSGWWRRCFAKVLRHPHGASLVHLFRLPERRASRDRFTSEGLIHRQVRLSTAERGVLWTTTDDTARLTPAASPARSSAPPPAATAPPRTPSAPPE
ncbi:hypothetical protein SALBM217S_02478 [Streptomyces griseoloalbus]